MPRVTLLGKPGCHLCDDARDIVLDVLASRPGIPFQERSILDDAHLRQTYAEQIPVVLIDDRVHAIWRVDRTRLERALAEADTA